MFSALFAAYAVLADHTAGGPDGLKLFNRGYVLLETMCLLFSSFTCGLVRAGHRAAQRAGDSTCGRTVTFALGAAFLGLELSEFLRMIGEGAAPDPQRLPVGLLHPGRHARPARHAGTDLARVA